MYVSFVVCVSLTCSKNNNPFPATMEMHVPKDVRNEMESCSAEIVLLENCQSKKLVWLLATGKSCLLVVIEIR